MALEMGAVREALIDAGASEGKASAAAQELAGYESRFTSIDREFSDVRSDLKLLKAMNAVNMAIGVAILLRLFIH